MKKFSFPKEQKICSSITISNLFRNGEKTFSYPLKAFYKPISGARPRILISVPKKRLKKASDRNHIKRLIRESFRLHQNLLIAEDKSYELTLVYCTSELVDFKNIENSFKQLCLAINPNLDN
jgi:ribonuclease P protein component